MDLKNKDLDDIAVESLRCKMTLKELLALLEMLGVEYTTKQIGEINNYRRYLQRVTRSPALGY